MLDFLGVMLIIFGVMDLFDDNYNVKKVLTRVLVGVILIGLGVLAKNYGVGF